MIKTSKTKMTLEKLSALTQGEFLALEKKFATKDDLKYFKDEIKGEMRDNMGKFLAKADQISGKLDLAIQEGRAGTLLYRRHDKQIAGHGTRISKLESAQSSK